MQVLALFTLASAPAPALAFAFAALAEGKNGGHEEAKGDEEDEEDKGKEERFNLELVRRAAPGRATLQQRLYWLGEQFEHHLLDLAHTQYLQEPLMLHPQHFGILER